jgi:hypothetical protein
MVSKQESRLGDLDVVEAHVLENLVWKLLQYGLGVK